jgi:putative DNA-invertase from lambdoid prophage Rac
MATYGYCRVSTKAQAEDGESLAVQERQIAGYALMLGFTVDQTFVEAGVSGSVPLQDRPQGGALLSILKSGDVVIASKLDRAFRDAGDALATMKTLKAQGVALHLIDLGGDVTGNGIGKLTFTILAAVAEQERDRCRERITQVKADQRQRGRYLGGKVPFGWRVEFDPIDPANPTKKRGGALVEIPEQQAAMATARLLRSSGAVLRTIREALTAEHGITLSLPTIAVLTS